MAMNRSHRTAGFAAATTVECAHAPGVKGFAPAAGPGDTDPDWQPL